MLYLGYKHRLRNPAIRIGEYLKDGEIGYTFWVAEYRVLVPGS